MSPRTHSRALASALAAVSAILLLCPAAIHGKPTAVQKKQQARETFDRAEAARTALDAKPAEDRKLSEYLAALRAYQSVVRLAPTIKQAPESLFHAAQLNQEIAQQFPSDKKAAEYRAEARRLYQFLNKEYPTNRFLVQAKKAMDDLDKNIPPEKPAVAKVVENVPVEKTSDETPATSSVSGGSAASRGKLVQVSNLRQWSTANYTRVVIDLEDEVKFEAGRISNPDRIYFDLHNTHLASSMNKSLDVEDGLLKKVRLGLNRLGTTRVVLEIGQIGTYSAFLLPNPYRLVIDIQGAGKPAPPKTEVEAKLQPPPAPRTEPEAPKAVKERPPLFAVRPRETPKETSSAPPQEESKSPAPEEVPITKGPTSKPVFDSVTPAATSSTPVTPPRPARDGHRSLTRALGLKIARIVIDPGHGGHDTGTIGPSGFAEKELVLDVAKRLGALVEERLGSEVVYTRDDDTFIPLENRTAVANQKQADLFVSVHANASRDSRARGVETYYLSFTTAPDALEVAARENAVSEKSIHELQDLVKKITLHEKVDESREFAAEVQKQLYTGISKGNAGVRNRGVRKAPFIVLIGANMPSILAEISFVSNPQDERLLKKAEYRQKVAESLFRGIQRYVNSLGGVKVAKN